MPDPHNSYSTGGPLLFSVRIRNHQVCRERQIFCQNREPHQRPQSVAQYASAFNKMKYIHYILAMHSQLLV